jgi:serine/threonine protein kinase
VKPPPSALAASNRPHLDASKMPLELSPDAMDPGAAAVNTMMMSPHSGMTLADSSPSFMLVDNETSAQTHRSKNSLFDMDFSAKPAAVSSRPMSPMMNDDVAENEDNFRDGRLLRASALLKRLSHHATASCLNDFRSGLTVLRSTLNEKQGMGQQPDADVALLQFFPIRKHFLGEGRFCKAYHATLEVADASQCDGEAQSVQCVVKQPHEEDQDALINSLAEAVTLFTILQHSLLLQPERRPKSIIRLFGIKMVDRDQIRLQRRPSELLASPLSSLRLFDRSPITSPTLELIQDMENVWLSAPSIVIEYCCGGNLLDYVAQHSGSIGKRMWIGMCRKIVQAVSFLHVEFDPEMAILHLDIKPHNILLDGDLEPKLADFGSAIFVRKLEDVASKHGLGRGTQAYAAPEMVTPPSFTVSLKSDIYALGCLFYYVLTGREPFKDITHPAYQLLSIRRGFWESGANPLTPVATPLPGRTNGFQRRTSAIQPPVGRWQENDLQSSSSQVSQDRLPQPMLLQFVNGDALHDGVELDRKAYALITDTLHKCCERDMCDRWTIQDVERAFGQIDEVLLPGTGFST